MNLQEYVWFHNLRGLVASRGNTQLDVTRYASPHMGWAKLHPHSTEHLETVQALLAVECMPIIQLQEGAHRQQESIYLAYIQTGAFWFEFGDPPNEDNPLNENFLASFIADWLTWAEMIVDIGGYPAFPMLAASDDPHTATLLWANAIFDLLKTAYRERFLYIVAHGLWFPVEMRVENRFYQQPADGPRHSARPYYDCRADEPGWHFEHPYDPIQQAIDRGRTIMGGTSNTPYGAPFGVIATAQMMQDLLKVYFDVGPVPIVASRGGGGPVLQPEDEPIQPHPAYPPMDHHSQVEATAAMVTWLVRRGPPWFWGMVLRDEHHYYVEGKPHTLITRWEKAAPQQKQVPSIETGGLAEKPTPSTNDNDRATTHEIDMSALVEPSVPDERPDTTPIDQPIVEQTEAVELLSDLDEAPLEETIHDEDTLMDLLAVEEPIILEPGEEPDPSMDLLVVLQPIRIPYAVGFVDAQAFAEAVEQLDDVADFSVLPTASDDRPDTAPLLPLTPVSPPPPARETLTHFEDAPPPMEEHTGEQGQVFFALLDAYTEVDEGDGDGMTALQRFDQMIASDGAHDIAMPEDEQDAPDFFDIVEELTGERPQPKTASHNEAPPHVVRAHHALQKRLRHASLVYVAHMPVSPAFRAYWEAFRPTLLSDLHLLEHIPPEAEPQLTVIAPRKQHTTIIEQVGALAPHITPDMIAVEELESILGARLR